MEAFKEKSLIIKTPKHNLEVRNCTKNDVEDEIPICQVDDFFSNNNNLELSKISILRLEDCDLNEIPKDLAKLNLIQLILARNKLREVPSCLYSGLDSLQLLDLSYNLIQNFDIEPACSCTIITLRINDNEISNFPHWILNLRCPKLEEVKYSNNYLMDLQVSHQINIKKLEMCNCQLLDNDFPFFKSLRNLEDLNISNNPLVKSKENNLKNIDKLFTNTRWGNLTILNLSNLTLSIIPHGIFWQVSLTELYLNNCDLSWISSDIQYLTNLTLLDVSSNIICSLPSELIKLEKLVVVKAPFNSICSVADFIQHLEILDLYENCLESYPACAKNVKFIDLELNNFDTENLDEYEEKREQYRKKFGYCRTNGFKEPPQSPVDDMETSYKTDSDSVRYDDYNSDDTENWDEEKSVIIKEKNPEITTSDDEWDGKVDLNTGEDEKGKISFQEYEEIVFCDANE